MGRRMLYCKREICTRVKAEPGRACFVEVLSRAMRHAPRPFFGAADGGTGLFAVSRQGRGRSRGQTTGFHAGAPVLAEVSV